LLAAVLRIVHRVITGFQFKQAGLKRGSADTGAVTLIQRFGSAACIAVAGGEVLFHEARAPTATDRSWPN
jgi:hypothetical protein